MDSFHIVDEQIREIKDDLPPGYYRLLPKLTDGPLQGYPRVSGIAWALVAHTDSAFDIQKLTRFVDAYQRVQPLTIGELWALAITLRITLVENLRRLADAIVAQLAESQLADTLADRILGSDKNDPEPASTILPSLDQAPWSTSFAVELSQRLRDRDPDVTPALRWLNDRLGAEGTTTDQIVRDEFQRQSAKDVTVRNVITACAWSRRSIGRSSSKASVRSSKVLRGASEFRDDGFCRRAILYRRAIEELARESGRDELEVAEQATAAAKRASDRPTKRDGDARRESDPGYYLIAEGRRAFEKELGCRVPLRTRLFRFNSDLGVTSYVGMIAMVTALVLALALLAVAHVGIGGWALLVLGIVGLVPASDVAVAIVNRAIAQTAGGTVLPGLELRDGVPPDLRTIVVVPTLLVHTSAIEKQIERLEVHHLSSPDENFIFALLSDWSDSADRARRR